MERSDSDFEDDDGSGSDLEEEDSDDEPREEEEEADCPTLPSDGEDSSADEHGGPEVAGSHDAAAAAAAAAGAAAGPADGEQAVVALLTAVLMAAAAAASTAGQPGQPDQQAVVAQVVACVKCWGDANAQLGAGGAPPINKLAACCKRGCAAALLLQHPKEVLEMAGTAKLLKLRFQDRRFCPNAASAAFSKGLKLRRRGAAGDHSTKGSASGPAASVSGRSARRGRRERQIKLDKFGHFQETRRRERKAWVQLVLPVLAAAGLCRKGIRTLLWCSNDFLYHVSDEMNMLAGLDLLQVRRQGSRRGLPAMAGLGSTACCSQCCLVKMPLAHRERQWDRWRSAKTNVEKLEALCCFLFSESTGWISARCSASFFLHLGVSRHRVEAARRFLAASAEEREAMKRHGGAGRIPWNRKDSAHVAEALAHFEVWTVKDPESDYLRPCDPKVCGVPALLRHLVSMHPSLAGVFSKRSYGRLIGAHLQSTSKTLLGWSSEHNVDPHQLNGGIKLRLCSVNAKLAENELQALEAKDSAAGGLPALRKEVEAKQADLAAAFAWLKEYVQAKKRVRAFNYQMVGVATTLEVACQQRTSDHTHLQGMEMATASGTLVDDKSPFNLPHLSADTAAGLEKYIVGENGQWDWARQRQTNYIMKPCYGPKDATGICWELFYDAVRGLETNTRIKITVMDGGPLNTSALVSYHWPQMMVDCELVDFYLQLLFKHYDGKMEPDGAFGNQCTLSDAIGLVVGVDDLARMVSSIPAAADGSFGNEDQHRGVIVEPAAIDELVAHTKGRMCNLEGVTRLELHMICAGSKARVATLPEIPLGLPGRWAGLTLRGLCEALRDGAPDGVLACRHMPDSKTVLLPAWNCSPTFVAPEPRKMKGYTPNTVTMLGHNSFEGRAEFNELLRARNASLPEGAEVSAEQQQWPGGNEYEAGVLQQLGAAGVDASLTAAAVVTRRNTIVRFQSAVGVDQDEAMANCGEGVPAGAEGAMHVVRVNLGERTESFPPELAGSKCLPGVLAHNEASKDVTVRARAVGLLNAVITEIGRPGPGEASKFPRGLEDTIHQPLVGERAAWTRRQLAGLRMGELDGFTFTAPPARPPTLYSLFVTEYKCKLGAEFPALGKSDRQRRAQDEWRNKYNHQHCSVAGRNRTNDLAHLQAKVVAEVAAHATARTAFSDQMQRVSAAAAEDVVAAVGAGEEAVAMAADAAAVAAAAASAAMHASAAAAAAAAAEAAGPRI